ncbi:hypothetical protein MCOR02_001672 [Pyricularia oryzae]|uniref:Aga1 a-agglutinin anchor subunit n=1 Tax=Pyricularia oryzae TaxID=318829 RepID=A0A4P7N091_PYROR|nr:hypothetical protein MCOR02_001672 [Pyricularia oryzae]KAI6479891.1 hypothetical protein MCOR13_011304 [Pyricularia oryzae]QBZ55629.1 hypothetical protein PoMZ_00531 [Pyricularia oryzae]
MSAYPPLSRTRSTKRPANAEPNDSDISRLPSVGESRTSTASPSRLPVKPSLSGIARSASVSTRTTTSSASTTAPRAVPKTRTGGLLSKLGSKTLRPAQQNENVAPARDAAGSGVTGTGAGLRRPTPSSAAVAPRPKTSGGPAGAERSVNSNHSRAKSSATTLTEATLLRPAQSSSHASMSTTSSMASRPPVTAQTKALHRRAPSNPVRTRTLDQPKPQQLQQPPQPEQPQAARANKPAFNTMQQHFSPLKMAAPKPLTSTFLAPPSPSKLPANVAITAETSRRQTELLQLCLLHREAGPTANRWHASARSRLAKRFDSVAKANAAVTQAKARRTEDVNAQALDAWVRRGGAHDPRQLEEKVHALDAVLSGLWELSEPGGRHARVVRQFEKWLEHLRYVNDRRECGVFDVDDEFVFISELDAAWHDECASMARKLDNWRTDLRYLEGGVDDSAQKPSGKHNTEIEEQSSLTMILAACHSLSHDMLEEIKSMEQIEREALKQESDWVEKIAIDDAQDDTPRAGAIWRVL